MKKLAFVVTLAAICVLEFSCLDFGQNVGPCIVIYRDAALHFESVTDAKTSAAIAKIRIRDIQINGVKQRDHYFTGFSTAYNLSAEDTVLYCIMPCGFGEEAGTYQFTASAPGYRDTTLTLHAQYARRESQPGGCPTILAGGTRVRFQMEPQ